MDTTAFRDALPLWALYLITTGIVLLSTEAGWRLGNYFRQRMDHKEDAPVGAVVGATLGLLAFLLAFTFGMAASRHDVRMQLVLQEANAIGTTYLRADLLPEPQRSKIRSLLREYATLRVANANSILRLETIIARSGAVQDQLWADAAAVDTQRPNSIVGGLFIQSLNEMIDLDAKRMAAGRNRIPNSIWLALSIVTILTMAAMGYQFGLTGEHSWPVTIMLALAFTTVLVLISDLDRPQAGLIRVNQQAMLDLIDKIGTTSTYGELHKSVAK